jgi:hypothetical protein
MRRALWQEWSEKVKFCDLPATDVWQLRWVQVEERSVPVRRFSEPDTFVGFGDKAHRLTG